MWYLLDLSDRGCFSVVQRQKQLSPLKKMPQIHSISTRDRVHNLTCSTCFLGHNHKFYKIMLSKINMFRSALKMGGRNLSGESMEWVLEPPVMEVGHWTNLDWVAQSLWKHFVMNISGSARLVSWFTISGHVVAPRTKYCSNHFW